MRLSSDQRSGQKDLLDHNLRNRRSFTSYAYTISIFQSGQTLPFVIYAKYACKYAGLHHWRDRPNRKGLDPEPASSTATSERLVQPQICSRTSIILARISHVPSTYREFLGPPIPPSYVRRQNRGSSSSPTQPLVFSASDPAFRRAASPTVSPRIPM